MQQSVATQQQARSLLTQSNEFQSQSRQLIFQANQTRRQLKQVQSQKRQQQKEEAKELLIKEAARLTKDLLEQQQRGAALRAQATKTRLQAIELFERATSQKWSRWIKTNAPLRAEHAVTGHLAHNARIRSVHPNMPQSSQGATSPSTNTEGMSLQVAALSSQQAPPDLNISNFQLSRDQRYISHIEVLSASTNAEDSESTSRVPLNQIHQWLLLLTDLDGHAVRGAKIILEGHMPGHVHGLPTQPLVSEEIEPGIYRVEGLKFQMRGWWVMQFHVSSPDSRSPETSRKLANNALADSSRLTDGTDTITFNLVL